MEIKITNNTNPLFKTGQGKIEWLAPQTKIVCDNKPDEFVKNDKTSDKKGMNFAAKIAVGVGILAAAAAGIFVIRRGRGSKLPKEVINKTNINSQINYNPKILGKEEIAVGNTIEERVNSFLNNKNYANSIKAKGIHQLTDSYEIKPHNYKDTANQTIYFTSRTSNLDYPAGNFILNGSEQIYINECPHFIINSNNCEFGIGKLADGRACVEFSVNSSRSDGDRIIRNIGRIISKDGNFTEAQIDLMKTLGQFKNGDELRGGYFPMLDTAREHSFQAPYVCNNNKSNMLAISEDVLLSGIQSWAKNIPAGQTNKFLERYKGLKPGESIIEDLSGIVINAQ